MGYYLVFRTRAGSGFPTANQPDSVAELGIFQQPVKPQSKQSAYSSAKESVWELCRAYGARTFVPLYPVLTHWANGFRRPAAASPVVLDHRGFRNRVLTQTLKRCATQNQTFSATS